jgi:bacterioferritin (cytochrome b1)
MSDQKIQPITENERWLLSFYRTSEISGALFFGRLAKSLKPGAIQHDMTKHFADESQHSWYWTECLQTLGFEPIKLDSAYQDQYVAAGGMPVNIMEILAITQVFEKRTIGQYALHFNAPGTHPVIKETLKKIMEDEKWHIHWVDKALESLSAEYGADHIKKTLEHYRAADQSVYEKSVKEHRERIEGLFTYRLKSEEEEKV